MNTQNNLKTKKKQKSNRARLFELILCIFFGTLMFCSKELMAFLPNIHLLGMFIMLTTITFRVKALISIYTYVFLEFFVQGLLWWLPNLYTWLILWGITMLLPKKMPIWAKSIIYPIVCALHGFAYGILYAPSQALLFGLDYNGMIAWIITGLPYDIIHGISNFVAGFLVLPLSLFLDKAIKKYK